MGLGFVQLMEQVVLVMGGLSIVISALLLLEKAVSIIT